MPKSGTHSHCASLLYWNSEQMSIMNRFDKGDIKECLGPAKNVYHHIYSLKTAGAASQTTHNASVVQNVMNCCSKSTRRRTKSRKIASGILSDNTASQVTSQFMVGCGCVAFLTNQRRRTSAHLVQVWVPGDVITPFLRLDAAPGARPGVADSHSLNGGWMSSRVPGKEVRSAGGSRAPAQR